MKTDKLAAPDLPSWLASMLPAGCVRYLISVGEQRMHVMEVNPDRRRTVLLVHGNPTWSFLYRKVAAALGGSDLRLVMPDLVGLGLSDKPRDLSAHTLAAHSGWLGALIDSLALDDFVLVGQDWGGPIGLHAAAERAERVAGLVILNTVVGPPKAGFRPTLFHRLSRVPGLSDALFRLGGFPQNILTIGQGDRRSMLGKVGRAYRYPLRHIRDRAAPLALARMVPDSLEHPSVAALQTCQDFASSFAGPSAIVWGDRDPILGRLRRRVESIMPRAEVTATRAGHFLQEEVPDQIAAAIVAVADRAARA